MLLVSKCIGSDSKYYHFHFKGNYKGIDINHIKLCKNNSAIKVDCNYMINIDVIDIKGSIILANIIDIKVI